MALNNGYHNIENTQFPTRLATAETQGYSLKDLNKKCSKNSNKKYKKTNKNSKDFMVCTLNTRTLRTPEKLIELKEALQLIQWDIIGISETKLFGQAIIESIDDHIFTYIGTEKGRNGVGFLIKSKWKDNIIDIKAFSDRIISLKLKISSCKIAIIQVYAPTEKAPLPILESFYKDLDKAIDYCTSEITLTIGDFNAKIGRKEEGEDSIMGEYGHGERNDRGGRLIDWLWQHRFTHCNSLFNKQPQRKWTWISPNNKIKNEIDHIITNKKKIIQDVSVLNEFRFESDHRLVRAKIRINRDMREVFKPKKVLNQAPSPAVIKEFQTNIAQRKNVLSNPSLNNTIQQKYDQLEKSILKTANNILFSSNQPSGKISKLSTVTKELIVKKTKMRSKGNLTEIELKNIRLLNKEITKRITEDIQEFNDKKIKEILDSNNSTKKANNALSEGKQWILSLERNDKEETNRNSINQIASNFYANLYTSSHVKSPIESSSETQPNFLISEIREAVVTLKNHKNSGTDKIAAEILKHGGDTIFSWLKDVFNLILQEEDVPKQWLESEIILLHKKGSKADINNYRPISLMSTIYKVFARCLLRRIKPILDCNQPIEQAGFRSSFSTIDHLQAVNQLIEKSREYQFPLYICFIDFNKAFDTILHNTIWKALEEDGIPSRYINILKQIYNNSKAHIKTDTIGKSFEISRGVRQGDPISPVIFACVLQYVFKRLQWENKGIRILGRYLSNLRFADDIVIFANSANELQSMLTELTRECAKVGLMANQNKTKVMSNYEKIPIFNDVTELDYVEDYIYLGQLISFTNRENKEIKRRVTNAWNKFWSLRYLFNMNISKETKKYIFDSNILPILTYGCQSWTFNKANLNNLKTCQRSMERSLLKIKKISKIRSSIIRETTGFTDVIEKAKSLKWQWAGHILRLENERWTTLCTNWIPLENARKPGRQPKRWRDDINNFARNYRSLSRNRQVWHELQLQFATQE